MSELVRLSKLLANWGIASRRSIEKLIDQKLISVDGKIVLEQGYKIDIDSNPDIVVDGQKVKKPSKRFSVYMLNKPANVLTTLKDNFGRKTIKSFINVSRHVYPVGRLDYNSTGLLLITDNGELANRLTHPSFGVEKEYRVTILGSTLSKKEKEMFRAGIELDDGKTAPCNLRETSNPQTYTVIIKEGRKRQIRRMFKKFHREVDKLHRTRIGPLTLSGLKPGEMRPLTSKEKKELFSALSL